MGLFWESSKEKEARENKALEAILKQFEMDAEGVQKQPQKSLDSKSGEQDKQTAGAKPEYAGRKLLNKCEDAKNLARFLADKGIISFTEWEIFARNNKNTNE